MTPLCAYQFARACATFLGMAYPDGPAPESKHAFLRLKPEDPVAPLLAPPICETLRGTEHGANELRGYAFRLGSEWFPHVKLQAQWCEPAGDWVFAVDTHDAIRLGIDDPDHARLRQLQDRNRQLKERVEQAWEADGLLTFNALLRRGLQPEVP